jgi:predicted Zn-dependent peptidase
LPVPCRGPSHRPTTYFFSLPSNKVELWAYLESERYFHGVLREFYRERNVVMEERRRGAESQPIGRPDRTIHRHVLYGASVRTAGGRLYVGPPVTHPGGCQGFFKKNYIPQNMVIAIVGDIEPQRTLQTLETYFGRLEPGEPEPIRTVEPKVPAPKTVTLYDPGQPWYLAGIRSHRSATDYPALMALSEVMSSGRTSRLYNRLVTEEKIAFFVGAFPGFPGSKYPGQMIFYATTAAGHTNQSPAG